MDDQSGAQVVGTPVGGLKPVATVFGPFLHDVVMGGRPGPAPGQAVGDLRVQKIAHAVFVSEDEAMDWGLIPDTRPPAPPVRVSRLRHLRRQVRAAAARARLRAGAWIAGVDPEEWEEWR